MPDIHLLVFDVTCPQCAKKFDSAAASLCGCVTPTPTLVCQRCKRCACGLRPDAADSATATAQFAKIKQARAALAGYDLSAGVREDLPRPLILVADDDPLILRATVRILSAVAGSIITAADGRSALELALRYSPDVVVSDAMMPGLDGRELCKELKSRPGTSGVKVIVMTSLYKGARYKDEAIRTFGVDDYLSKPVEPATLLAAAERQLDGIATASIRDSLRRASA
ncbi:MAG: response regulator [Thermoanaerobaculia bacterium]